MKKKNIELGKIEFGLSDGDDESREENFIEAFYSENGTFELLSRKEKFIVSGRKGTGKTSLARYYQEKLSLDNKLVVTQYIKYEATQLEKLLEFGDAPISTEERYHFQEYMLYMLIAKSLISEKKTRRAFGFKQLSYIKYSKALKSLNNFLGERNSESNFEKIITKLNEKGTADARIGTKNSNFGVSGEYSEESMLEMQKFYKVLRTLEDTVSCVLNFVPIVLVIDDFDDKIDLKEDSRIEILIEIIKNAKDINRDIGKDGVSKCILLIRDDIIQSLHSHDSNINKMADSIVRISWSEGNNEKHLKNMICKRIYLSEGSSNERMVPNKIWDSYFAKPNNKKSKSKSFMSDLLVYTFWRPRDVIKFMNCMRDLNMKAHKFNYPMMKQALGSYSEWFINELKNEMKAHYDSESIEAIFILLSDFKRVDFNFPEFDLFRTENHHKYKISMSNKELMETLYTFGIVGQLKAVEGKNSVDWSYYSNSRKVLDIDYKLIIHPGVRQGLNMQRKRTHTI